MKNFYLSLIAILFFVNHNFSQQDYLISDGGTVNTCAGTLYDSGGATGNYGPDESHVMTICSDDGNPVVLNFTQLDIEDDGDGGCYDVLYIYDGTDVNSPLLGTVCNGVNVPFVLESTGTCLTFEFISDYNFELAGFTAEISCAAPNPCAPDPEVYLTNVGFYESGTNGITQDLPPSMNYHASNPNNYINPGNTVVFKVEAYNNLNSGNNLVSAECEISTTEPDVTIVQNTSGLNNVGWNSQAWSTGEFMIEIDPTVQPGSILTFDFVVTDNLTNTEYETKCVEFVVAPLSLQQNSSIDDDDNPDSDGDNDGIVEPNEVIEFLPYLENVSPLSASAVIGMFFDPNNCSDLNVWADTTGSSGQVVNWSSWNINMNQPQPIAPGATDMLPEYDFVFGYYKNDTYKFDMGLDMAGLFNIVDGGQSQSLVKWYIPCTFNPSYPDAPACTASNDKFEFTPITIYPNPVREELTISVSIESIGKTFAITDNTGKIVLENTFYSTLNKVNVTSLDSGVYFISSDNSSQPIKFIKQ